MRSTKARCIPRMACLFNSTMGPSGTEASHRLWHGGRGQHPPIVLELNLHTARLAAGTAGLLGWSNGRSVGLHRRFTIWRRHPLANPRGARRQSLFRSLLAPRNPVVGDNFDGSVICMHVNKST